MLSRTSTVYVAVALSLGLKMSAQPPTAQSRDSLHRAVQQFYDWYLPQAAHPRGQDVIMNAATHGPLPFDTPLIHWLRVDSAARARSKGEIDGLDGDPYLNAQDPCDQYTVQAVRWRGSLALVDILGRGGCESHRKPDVTVELALKGGRWTITEFRDPGRKNEGLLPLLKRLHPKAK